MSRLQIRLFGPYFSSFLIHSYGYEPANELKSVLKHPNFRFGPHSPTPCLQRAFSVGLFFTMRILVRLSHLLLHPLLVSGPLT